MAKKIVIGVLFVFLIILMSFNVSSAGVVNTYVSISGDKGYIITPTLQGLIKQSKDYIFNFFVYNKTSGLVEDNSNLNCTFYLSKSNGELIFTENSTYMNGYWSDKILGDNFSELNTYNYGVECNNGEIGGALIGVFKTSYSGKEISTAQSILYGFFVFIIIFFMFSLFFIMDRFPKSNERDEEGRILSISYLKYTRPVILFTEWMLLVGVLYITSNLAFSYLYDTLLAKVLFVLFRITFGITPLIVILWLVWIFVKMYHDAQFQKMIKRGIYPSRRL